MHFGGIARERLGRGQLHRIESCPDSGSIVLAEGTKATFGGNACARDDENSHARLLPRRAAMESKSCGVEIIMAQGKDYAIRGGAAGRERLRILSRVMHASTTFDRVCLDVACGGGD